MLCLPWNSAPVVPAKVLDANFRSGKHCSAFATSHISQIAMSLRETTALKWKQLPWESQHYVLACIEVFLLRPDH